MTVYVLDPLTGVWNIGGQPRVEDECAVGADGADMECPDLAVDLPQGSTLAVSFPTFVAPGAAVTGAASIEPGAIARLHLGASSWDSFEATAVASSDPVRQSTEFPATGARVVEGGANPGTIVTIESAATGELGSTRADAAGRWAVLLPPGFGPIDAVFETLDGVRSIAPAGYYNSYAFSLASPAGDATWATAQALTGSGQPGSEVVIRTANGTRLTDGYVDASGTWTLALPDTLAPGEHEIVVTNTISDGSSTTLHLRGRVVASASPLPSEPTSSPTPTPSTPRIVVSVSNGNAVANGEDVRIVRVVVSDSAGAPLAGEWVQFNAPGGLTPSTSTALTDVQGVATTTVAADQPIAAPLTVRSAGVEAMSPPIGFVADSSPAR
jgi:hypothetical protein